MRDLGFLGWTAAGGALVVQLALPWTTIGPLARSTPAQLLRLIDDGALDGLVPAVAIPMLLALPAAGIVLLGTAAVHARWAKTVRLAASVLAAAITATLLWQLTDGQPGRIAPGGWVTAAAALLATVASLVQLRRSRATPR